jgi:zinc transport system permease protein
MGKERSWPGIIMIEIFQYGFMTRALIAGLIVGIISPMIGIFLVLRRYSLITDTLSHVSLAGIALGLLLKVNPVLTAVGTTTVASVIIEKLRMSKKVYGESALAMFLSGSLALAVVLLSIANGFNSGLFNYLFGSILTVKESELITVSVLGAVVMIILSLVFKELVFISFDEETAAASGIAVKKLNTLFVILAAVAISLSIPIVGVLLISALVVIPVTTALQLKLDFGKTLLAAELFSVISVVLGIILSYYANTPPGGTIVLLTIAEFVLALAWKSIIGYNR